MINSKRSASQYVFRRAEKVEPKLLFEVISQCYVRGSIIITANLPFDEWIEVFGSERLTDALLDRLTHHVHILEMDGESYHAQAQSQITTIIRTMAGQKGPA